MNLVALVVIAVLAPFVAVIYVVLAVAVMLDNVSLGLRPLYGFKGRS